MSGLKCVRRKHVRRKHVWSKMCLSKICRGALGVYYDFFEYIYDFTLFQIELLMSENNSLKQQKLDMESKCEKQVSTL